MKGNIKFPVGYVKSLPRDFWYCNLKEKQQLKHINNCSDDKQGLPAVQSLGHYQHCKEHKLQSIIA